MSMSIIYDGLLQTYVAEYIKDAAKKYGHAIEMRSLPPNWNKWTDENLVDYTITGTTCFGGPSSRETKMYCVIHREDKTEPLFLFLKTEKERDAVVRAFPDLVVNENPFRTSI